jgi:hypothetical protein
MTTTYNVYRNGTLRTSGLTSPTYVDTGLTDGTTYTYAVSATVNGIEGPKSSPVLATPTAIAPVPGGGTIASFPTTGGTAAAFLALASNMNIDTIEMAAGTYKWPTLGLTTRYTVNRSSRPLLVRPAAGATVIWDGTGIGGDGWFYCGDWTTGGSSIASYLTFDPAGTGGSFNLQNYTLGQHGLVQTEWTSHCTFNGFNVTGCTGQGGTSWCIYVSSDGTHRGDNLTFRNWNFSGSGNTMGFFQSFSNYNSDTGLPTSCVVNSNTIDHAYVALLAWGDSGTTGAGFTFNGNVMTHCTYALDFKDSATGTYLNNTSTGSLNSSILTAAGMTNGGGNSLA